MSDEKIIQNIKAGASRFWGEVRDAETWNPRLRPSMLGSSCERFLTYNLWGCNDEIFEPRLIKLFDVGRREEEIFINELRFAGIKVLAEEDGAQLKVSAKDLAGHLTGSVDALLKDVPFSEPGEVMLGEFKTGSEKYTKEVAKNGVQMVKPVYYAQMQIYMGLLREKGLKVHRALYAMVNKNTSETLYEIVHFKQEVFDALIEKAKRILRATKLPAKLSNNPTYFECRFCPTYNVCHDEQLPKTANCRNCINIYATKGGEWKCKRFNQVLDLARQKIGCHDHLFKPDLVPAELLEIDPEAKFIRYSVNNKEFCNVIKGHPLPNGLRSCELIVDKSIELIQDPFIQSIKEEFTGTKIVSSAP